MRTGSNAVEATKASVGGDGLRVREQLPRLVGQGYESLTNSEKDLLKWVGVFFRKPTPGKFMMRVRMPNGFTSSIQLRAIADLSRRLGNCVLDITTRQQIQLRGFELGSVTEIWEKLRGVDLYSLQTGMDNVRNISGCALSGLTLNELFDASLVVAELDTILVGKNGNPEFTNLPRKFNITITACVQNCTHDESQDVALVPAMRRDRVGFNVLVGGKMGSGGFTIASPLDVFVWIPKAAQLVAALVGIFRDHGPRDARSKCRFAFLIEEWGLARVREEVSRRVDHYLEPAGRDVRSQYHSDHLGITPQKQPGYRSVGLCVPMGRLYPDQMHEMARLAEEYGNGEIRLTTGQNAILANVPDDRLDSLLQEDLLDELSPHPSRFHRKMVACTGTDYCNLAQIDTKGQAAELSRLLDEKLGTVGPAVSLHWSGCPAGCGNHQAADVGFRGFKARVDGKTVDAVAIYKGGRTGPEAVEGKEIMGLVPLGENLPDLVAKLIECLDPEAGAPRDQPPLVVEASATVQQALVDAPPPGDSSRLEMP
ncbi:MAG TPA: ferredoxin--nitrite reductase [Candidatus Polarisedimenticolia bacterium]|nr:ferredoxin--nitrite reductase [Candidatus Polarisedimenticolia bacterium]